MTCTNPALRALLLSSATSILLACGAGDSTQSNLGLSANTALCTGNCATDNPASASLTVSDVQTIIAQAVHEAQAQQLDATIAVADRVGNVLAVYRHDIDGDPLTVLLATHPDSAETSSIKSGLEGIFLPTSGLALNIDDQAAIAKAITGAYLSSEGNAFSTRTASQIVQDHFNPGEENQPSGPLFGVQFSQLACSDFTVNNSVGYGPKQSPLGLAADPGGFPLYKNGTVVGGIGVISDGVYGIDLVITDTDVNSDELIALAGTFGFGAPVDRRADQITVDGKVFRFSDVDYSDLSSDPTAATAFASLPAGLTAVPGYTVAAITAGTAFGQAASGIRADTGDFAALDGFIFVDATDTNRFPPVASTDGGMTQAETLAVLQEALEVANDSRAQIRKPLNSQARVTISVVDTTGTILGMVRTRDAPVFGADVSLQKARTAMFYSSSQAASLMGSLPDAQYIRTNNSEGLVFNSSSISDYVSDVQAFLGDSSALTNGAFAFTDRAGGNLSRPYFPDGLDDRSNGPLSKPKGEWSVFSTGAQLDVVINSVLQHVLFTAGAIGTDVGSNCVGTDLATDLSVSNTNTNGAIANGMQIFPGSVPIYKGATLVGGIGISGDGVDQDDMIAFLAVHNASLQTGIGINNAPLALRADQLTPQGTRLRYVQCPQAPFIDSDADNVCDGK